MELIATDAQRLNQEVKVILFEIDATAHNAGVLRFTPGPESATFAGQVFQALPISAEGFEWNGTGTAPRPTLSLTAMNLVFLSMVINSDDLVGCPVRRIRTYRKYLDDGATPNSSAYYPIDYYQINKKTSQKRKDLVFELATPTDQQGKQIPGRQVLRDSCSHRFRYWANGQWNYDGVTCPYAGAAMYDAAGQPTTDPTKAKCGKRLSDCVVHFGSDATLPMFAFPGVGRIS